MARIKLENFFLVERGTTFKDPSELRTPVAPGAPAATVQEPEEVNRLQTLPPGDAKKLQQIERMCHELAQSQEGDPDLKQVVHKFLLDLNGWMGETD